MVFSTSENLGANLRTVEATWGYLSEWAPESKTKNMNIFCFRNFREPEKIKISFYQGSN